MRKSPRLASSRLVVAAVSVMVLTSACQGDSSPTPDPTSSPSASATNDEADVAPYESGPESPLGYGLEVPEGATQLGPLTRLRSARLVTTFAPDLQAALSQQQADERAKAVEDAAAAAEDEEQDGQTPSATPTEASPTPDTRPSDDSFEPLEEQPRPDTIISVMRIDGPRTQVVRRMLAQITAMLPEAEVPDRLSPFCKVKDDRITGCRLQVTGMTADDREVRVDMTVDPGDVSTRTAPPSALRRPVMTVQISYVGDPRQGQEERESSDIGDVAEVDDSPDPDGLIWPSMDLDAPSDTPLAGDFSVPEDATVLLSGFTPSFVELTTDKAATADELAQQWVADRASGTVSKDVVEDLNEVGTTYSGTKGDTFYRATYVLSARGNYVLLMVYPQGTTP